MEFTCKGCQLRQPGCHSNCEKYIAEKKAHEERKAMERKIIDANNGLRSQRDDSVRKAIRRAKHAKRYFT